MSSPPITALVARSDKRALVLLAKNRRAIREVVAYQLQRLLTKVTMRECLVSGDVRAQYAYCGERLALIVDAPQVERPRMDNAFAKKTAQLLLEKCPELADLGLSVHVRGKDVRGTFTQLYFPVDPELQQEVVDLLERVRSHRYPDA